MPELRDIAVVVLSESGMKTAEILRAALPGARIHALSGRADGDVAFEETGDHLRRLFEDGIAVVGLCSTAILIRLLAPVLDNKAKEPPVIAVSEDGQAVVPLLGGHQGANELAVEIGKALGIEPAITTSGDRHFKIALDQPPDDLRLANPESYKPFMARLLKGEKILVDGDHDWLAASALPFDPAGTLKITVGTAPLEAVGDGHLVFYEKRFVLGLGAERGASPEAALALAQAVLKEANVAAGSLAAIASLDVKADETAIHDVAKTFNVPAWFFDKEQLAREEPRLQTPSEIVRSEVGVAGVAEGAALAASGANGILTVPKMKGSGVTAALAKAPACRQLVPGRSRGRVSLIGVGPGTPDWRSREAIQLLRAATDWVGYGLYLDLVADLRHHQTEHRFDLGAEEKRVRHALELAGEGRDVAVVCSGDPGIFAMATLAFELIDTGASEGLVSDAAKRVEIVVAPGISAFQAAAARAGAPVGHDFCCLSLSDLLTPREDILRRLQAAADGDFVVALYNPRSKRRITLLDEAFALFRETRGDDTPVILATDLGRPAEHVRVETLASVKSEDVDMLTIVIVGSSNSERVMTGDGKTHVYTPRGYHRKTS
ncbi:MAG: precorrin-3B C(17)-methyltransferase [Pseudomonadota bacterium]